MDYNDIPTWPNVCIIKWLLFEQVYAFFFLMKVW